VDHSNERHIPNESVVPTPPEPPKPSFKPKRKPPRISKARLFRRYISGQIRRLQPHLNIMADELLKAIKAARYSILTIGFLIIFLILYSTRREDVTRFMLQDLEFPKYFDRAAFVALLGVTGRRLLDRTPSKDADISWGLYVSELVGDFFFVPIAVIVLIYLGSTLQFSLNVFIVDMNKAPPMFLNAVAFILGGLGSYRLAKFLRKIAKQIHADPDDDKA